MNNNNKYTIASLLAVIGISIVISLIIFGIGWLFNFGIDGKLSDYNSDDDVAESLARIWDIPVAEARERMRILEADIMRDPVIEVVLMYLEGERVRLESLIESYKADGESFVDFDTGKILTSDDLAKRRAYLSLELVNVLRLMNELVEKQIEIERAK